MAEKLDARAEMKIRPAYEVELPTLDPRVAVILLYYYSHVSSPEVPKWIYDHPYWPKHDGTGRGRLRASAREHIYELIKELGLK